MHVLKVHVCVCACECSCMHDLRVMQSSTRTRLRKATERGAGRRRQRRELRTGLIVYWEALCECVTVCVWMCTLDQWLLCDSDCTATNNLVHTHSVLFLCNTADTCPAFLQRNQTEVVVWGQHLKKELLCTTLHYNAGKETALAAKSDRTKLWPGRLHNMQMFGQNSRC